MATSDLDKARVLLRAYWGETGADKDLRRDELRKLKLKHSDLEILMDGLPPPNAGTSGSRIAECYRFLERLSRA